MEELSFPNGIALSNNEEFFIMAETGSYKLWRYWIKGDKRGQKEVFAVTPGSPDNIKATPDGHFIVGIGNLKSVFLYLKVYSIKGNGPLKFYF